MRRTYDNAGVLWMGLTEFDATQVTYKSTLERLVEAAAAPEHERNREDQPAEGVADGWSLATASGSPYLEGWVIRRENTGEPVAPPFIQTQPSS